MIHVDYAPRRSAQWHNIIYPGMGNTEHIYVSPSAQWLPPCTSTMYMYAVALFGLCCDCAYYQSATLALIAVTTAT